MNNLKVTRKRGCKSGQVWVETVVYTLIAFALIGLVLAFVKPKIEELQDKAIIEQTIQMMEEINLQIDSIRDVPGNKRSIELVIKKGALTIDGVQNKILFELESRYAYSEFDKTVSAGGSDIIFAKTIEKGKYNDITLEMDFQNDFGLTYEGEEEIKLLSSGPTAHKLFVESKMIEDKLNINFELG